MTHKSIKLLALAVVFGCSSIALVLAPPRFDFRIVVMLTTFLVTGIWFLIYWFLCDERQS